VLSLVDSWFLDILEKRHFSGFCESSLFFGGSLGGCLSGNEVREPFSWQAMSEEDVEISDLFETISLKFKK